MFNKVFRIIKTIFFLEKKKPIILQNEFKNKSISGTIIIGDFDKLNIGENVSFGGNVTLYANAEIYIGSYSMIAINVIIHTSTHNYNSHPMNSKRIDRPIKIGKHVWIGVGAIILPGVIIGNYCVIGAGSVVTSNIPDGAIAVGNPARILKYRNPEIYMTKFNPKEEVWRDNIFKESYLVSTAKNK